MNITSRCATLTIALLLGLTGPVLSRAARAAADPAPNVALTVAVIDAGGGTQHYDTVQLFGRLAGRLAGPELTRLRFQYGKRNVASFLSVFDFAVKDIVLGFRDRHVNMDIAPLPDPRDGRALSAALVTQASRADGTLDVDTMLDRLLAPAGRERVRNDIDKSFGTEADRNFRAILLQSLQDMKRANHF